MRKYCSYSYLRIALILVLFCTMANHVMAGDDDKPGIKFRDITFKQAVAAAKAENKLVFLHGFADWCHYCMYMKDSVYTDKEVGDFFNANFVSIRMDLEKEGAELNKALMLHTFPGMFFYDANGELVHRAAGRRYRQPFMELGREALDPNRQMRTFKRKYEDGTATPYQVQFYFRMEEVAGMDAQLQINDYLLKQPDSAFTSANNWRIMYDIVKDPTLPMMKRIIGNKKALEAKYTPDSINNKLLNLYYSYLIGYVQRLDSTGYEAAKKQVRGINGLDIREKIVAWTELNKMKMKSQWDTYKIESQKFAEKYAMDDSRRLYDICNVYYESFNSHNDLMILAEKLLKRSVELADRYKANHLLASVSFRLNKKEQALAEANHAIEVAKRDNNDYKATTLLIDRIQKMP